MDHKEKHHKNEEWMQKIMAVSEANKKEEEAEEAEEEKYLHSQHHPKHPKTKKSLLVPLILSVVLFLIAVVPRLYFVFVVSNPDNPGAGWFGDAYHHWQIAYLTQEIGMSHGFLRLWDLKGMEYFWGLLHPLVMLISMGITGDHSVGLERAVTAIAGSFSVVLVFLIARKHWNMQTAIAAALLAALNPVGVFNDGTGMVEPLGIPFLLLGVYLFPSVAWLSGACFAIALMARGEYWAFSFAMVIGMMLFTKEKIEKKLLLGVGFAVVFFAYVKYLMTWTSNPIYPFYQNFMANYVGTWQLKTTLEPQDIQAKYIFLAIFIISCLWSLLILWKKPRGMFFYLIGLANWAFLGAMFGLGAYIKSYMTYVWYVRFMILPYIFVGLVIAVALFYYLPKIKYLKFLDTIKVNWLILLSVLIVSQYLWTFIWAKYSTTIPTWNQTMQMSKDIAVHYHGGGLLLFEGNPDITYALVQHHNVEGKNIVGQMFDPYFYMTGDPYADWEEENREKVLKWIKENNIRTIATYAQYTRYAELAKREPQFFTEGVAVPNTNFVIYQVKDELYNTEL